MKYDWSKVPKWATYLAADSDGSLWAYENAPERATSSWVRSSLTDRLEKLKENTGLGSIWDTSLEARPVPDPQPDNIPDPKSPSPQTSDTDRLIDMATHIACHLVGKPKLARSAVDYGAFAVNVARAILMEARKSPSEIALPYILGSVRHP